MKVLIFDFENIFKKSNKYFLKKKDFLVKKRKTLCKNIFKTINR
jgi:hypothetical protein